MKIAIEVPEEYPWILLFLVILCIEYVFVGFTAVVGSRKRVFGADFMRQFKYEHQAAFGASSRVAPLGFPDSGNGLFADKLPYRAWYDLNNNVRVHVNMLESLPTILVFVLVCGLYCPEATLIITAMNCVTRLIYVFMYSKYGPDQRVIGAVAGSAPLYGLGLYTLAQIIYQTATTAQ